MIPTGCKTGWAARFTAFPVLLTGESGTPELFGHEQGGLHWREGAVALVGHGGTLFLDEIGELPPPLQSQLLRVLQEQTYKRVGGNSWRQSRFRADLFYRIAGLTCTLPLLRERSGDILPLVRYFLCGLNPGQ